MWLEGKGLGTGGRRQAEMGLGPGLMEASRTLLGLRFSSNSERASNGGSMGRGACYRAFWVKAALVRVEKAGQEWA